MLEDNAINWSNNNKEKLVQIVVNNSDFRINVNIPKPNIWYRFWYKVLLNIDWLDVP